MYWQNSLWKQIFQNSQSPTTVLEILEKEWNASTLSPATNTLIGRFVQNFNNALQAIIGEHNILKSTVSKFPNCILQHSFCNSKSNTSNIILRSLFTFNIFSTYFEKFQNKWQKQTEHFSYWNWFTVQLKRTRVQKEKIVAKTVENSTIIPKISRVTTCLLNRHMVAPS